MANLLGQALHEAGHDIVEIYNRSYKRGETLAANVEARSIRKIEKLSTDIDLILIAVSDDVIGKLSERIEIKPLKQTIIVHTSGSVPSTVLNKHKSYGVFYPFQSMTTGHTVNFKEVPILIDAQDQLVLDQLNELANSISNTVHKVSDDQRKIIHLSGVFANNFTNHLISLAKGILEQNKLPFDVIKPLIKNTLQKVLEVGPYEAQTGPAVRGDDKIIERHMELLESESELQMLYKTITKSIGNHHDSKS